MDRKPIVVVGSINMDLVARADRIPRAGETVHSSDFQTHPGGKGANQAVAAARLGYPVRMIGRVGSDSFGEELRGQLLRSGVDASRVQSSQGPSGVAVIAVAPNGENAIVVTPGANALVMPEDVDENGEVIREAGIVLSQLEIPIETVQRLSEVCAGLRVPLMLDPSPARLMPAELLRKITWLTPNETEVSCCLPNAKIATNQPEAAEIADELVRLSEAVVLKMGSRGAFIATRSGTRQHVDAFRVTAVDTTAAGDAFNGAFAVGLMLGKPPAEAARFAAAAAAISVTRAGAQPSMPTMDEVNELLSRAGGTE